MYLGIDIGGTKCALVKGRRLDNGEIEVIEKIRFDTLSSAFLKIYIDKPLRRLYICSVFGCNKTSNHLNLNAL